MLSVGRNVVPNSVNRRCTTSSRTSGLPFSVR